MWQHINLSEEICPRDTPFCWDVKQPTNNNIGTGDDNSGRGRRGVREPFLICAVWQNARGFKTALGMVIFWLLLEFRLFDGPRGHSEVLLNLWRTF